MTYSETLKEVRDLAKYHKLVLKRQATAVNGNALFSLVSQVTGQTIIKGMPLMSVWDNLLSGYVENLLNS